MPEHFVGGAHADQEFAAKKAKVSPRGAECVAEISELAVSGTYAGHEVVPKKIRSAAQWMLRRALIAGRARPPSRAGL
jgi:hypothetical protein